MREGIPTTSTPSRALAQAAFGPEQEIDLGYNSKMDRTLLLNRLLCWLQ
jgi:hypothetical protein|tara:strand:- start:1640 stop:1786 length:147 start_codon:yes stop_codon:yes gene_type:complete